MVGIFHGYVNLPEGNMLYCLSVRGANSSKHPMHTSEARAGKRGPVFVCFGVMPIVN